ncbi:hypothetical protein JCM4814A_92370 [Streptomyces phaeofaciens JCM 4814]|uniref:Uncharacterized protein n=1 Tax=Streptomyces phaeofaciens TaxID=68254 RepID=A0A918LYN4_9ACTN|nr:hypothetical protein [Streptomyces phaeofaciens]GGT70679.1 hypothetical protein GCM10010226_55710 [Streptomyces phaeofaciens]
MTRPDVPAALCATGLGFHHPKRGGPALRDWKFTVPGGRVTAIVGHDGAGRECRPAPARPPWSPLR